MKTWLPFLFLLLACSSSHPDGPAPVLPDAGYDAAAVVLPQPGCAERLGAPTLAEDCRLGACGELIELPEELQGTEDLRLEVGLDSASVGVNCPPLPIALPPGAPEPEPTCAPLPVLSVRGDEAPVVHERLTNLHDDLVDLDGVIRAPTTAYRTPSGGTALIEQLPDASLGPRQRLSLRQPGGAIEEIVPFADRIEVPFASAEVVDVVVATGSGATLRSMDAAGSFVPLIEAPMGEVEFRIVDGLRDPNRRFYCVADEAGASLVAITGLELDEPLSAPGATSCEQIPRLVIDAGGSLWFQVVADDRGYGPVYRVAPEMAEPVEVMSAADRWQWNVWAGDSGWHFQQSRTVFLFVTENDMSELHVMDLGSNPFVWPVVEGDKIAVIGRNRWTTDSMELVMLERGVLMGSATVATSREGAPNNLQHAWFGDDGALWFGMYDEYVGPLPRDIRSHLYRFDGSTVREIREVERVGSVQHDSTVVSVDGTFYRHAGDELSVLLEAAGLPQPLFEDQFPDSVDPLGRKWFYFPTHVADGSDEDDIDEFAIATFDGDALEVRSEGGLVPGYRVSHAQTVQDRSGRAWLYHGKPGDFGVDAWLDGDLCNVHAGQTTVRYASWSDTIEDDWKTAWGVRLSTSENASSGIAMCPFLADDGVCIALPAGVTLVQSTDIAVTASGHLFALVVDDDSGRVSLFRSSHNAR